MTGVTWIRVDDYLSGTREEYLLLHTICLSFYFEKFLTYGRVSRVVQQILPSLTVTSHYHFAISGLSFIYCLMLFTFNFLQNYLGVIYRQ